MHLFGQYGNCICPSSHVLWLETPVCLLRGVFLFDYNVHLKVQEEKVITWEKETRDVHFQIFCLLGDLKIKTLRFVTFAKITYEFLDGTSIYL